MQSELFENNTSVETIIGSDVRSAWDSIREFQYSLIVTPSDKFGNQLHNIIMKMTVSRNVSLYMELTVR